MLPQPPDSQLYSDHPLHQNLTGRVLYCKAGVASAAHHAQAQHTQLHISLSNTTVTKSYPCRITARATCTCAMLKRHPCPVATNYDAGNANDATLEYKQQRQGLDFGSAPPVRYILQHAHRGTALLLLPPCSNLIQLQLPPPIVERQTAAHCADTQQPPADLWTFTVRATTANAALSALAAPHSKAQTRVDGNGLAQRPPAPAHKLQRCPITEAATRKLCAQIAPMQQTGAQIDAPSNQAVSMHIYNVYDQLCVYHDSITGSLLTQRSPECSCVT